MSIIKIFPIDGMKLNVAATRYVPIVHSDFQRSNLEKHVTSSCSMGLWRVILYTAE